MIAQASQVRLNTEGKPPSLPYQRWYGAAQHAAYWREVFQGEYAAVHLSTPPSVTGQLLVKLAATPVELVTADKPWFSSLASAQAAAPQLTNSQVTFRFFDHYCYRGAMQWLRGQDLATLLGGELESIDICLFESAPFTSEAQAEAGILADLAIHGVSMVHSLLPGRRFQVQQATAARDAAAPAQIDTCCRFEMQSYAKSPITVRIAAAKYAPPAAAGKHMWLASRNGRLKVDLAADTVDSERAGEWHSLYAADAAQPTAYELLVRHLAEVDPEIGFQLPDALAVLQVLADVRALFDDQLRAPTAADFACEDPVCIDR